MDNRSRLIVVLCLGLAAVGARTARAEQPIASAASAETPLPEYLVGIYYFSGWWRPEPNKWMPHGKDWRADYPGRIPTLGEYNEQPTLDKEIVAAAEHGVSFFQFL